MKIKRDFQPDNTVTTDLREAKQRAELEGKSTSELRALADQPSEFPPSDRTRLVNRILEERDDRARESFDAETLTLANEANRIASDARDAARASAASAASQARSARTEAKWAKWAAIIAAIAALAANSEKISSLFP